MDNVIRGILLATGATVWACWATVMAAVAIVTARRAIGRLRVRRELSDRHLARTVDQFAEPRGRP